MTEDDLAADWTVEVWPENAHAVRVFHDMGTQWRVSQNGPYGLDYSVIPFILRTSQVPRAEWPDVMDAIRLMEGVALQEMQNNKAGK